MISSYVILWLDSFQHQVHVLINIYYFYLLLKNTRSSTCTFFSEYIYCHRADVWCRWHPMNNEKYVKFQILPTTPRFVTSADSSKRSTFSKISYRKWESRKPNIHYTKKQKIFYYSTNIMIIHIIINEKSLFVFFHTIHRQQFCFSYHEFLAVSSKLLIIRVKMVIYYTTLYNNDDYKSFYSSQFFYPFKQQEDNE